MNAFTIRPIAETPDSVTLSRADFEALQTLLEDAADLADIEAVSRRIADVVGVPLDLIAAEPGPRTDD